MPCEKEGEEENFVAKANNWAQRINTEMDAARIWVEQWGALLGDEEGKPSSIESLEKELTRIKKNGITKMTSVSRESYKGLRPYREWDDYRRKSRSNDN
jgi:hypothetical protein